MEHNLEKIEIAHWDEVISTSLQKKAIKALESGKILYLPHLAFSLNDLEKQFLAPHIVAPKSKNISYHLGNDRLGGSRCEGVEAEQLKAMIKRYALKSRGLITALLPSYVSQLMQARTSFRPVEAAGRQISSRKDDTLLHVDAFPASPAKGQRILRVFTNVNPIGKPRHWRIGEPFQDVVKKFADKISPPLPAQAFFLKLFKITKDTRTLYDHYMLGIHDTMKADQNYQNTVKKTDIEFPAGATWIVYTDQVSHAALGGQHLFEQTFHLPPEAMQFPEMVPLHVLENFLKKQLVSR